MNSQTLEADTVIAGAGNHLATENADCRDFVSWVQPSTRPTTSSAATGTCRATQPSSLSGLTKSAARSGGAVPISPNFGANSSTIDLKFVKICPHFPLFSLRLIKSDRLLALKARDLATQAVDLDLVAIPQRIENPRQVDHCRQRELARDDHTM